MTSGPIYTLRPVDVYEALETSPRGIPEAEVSARQALYGKNTLTEMVRVSLGARLWHHFNHWTTWLLIVMGILLLFSPEWPWGFVIWSLVLVNTAVSYWREYRAEAAMQALRHLLPAYARIMRDGTEQKVLTEDIVPGDILILAEGDRIPADARVIEAFGFRTDNSTLTGDAIPVLKTADPSLREGISEIERPNLIFAGTTVVSGTARAVVFSTGMLTQFGRIAHLTQAVAEPPSPLQVELNQLTRRTSILGGIVGIVVALVIFFDPGNQGFTPWQGIFLGLGVIAAIVPEGLPATVTLALALAGQKLAGLGVLIKRLSVIETMGSVSVICTDKSGTLTQNQMTVRELWVSGHLIQVSGVGYEPKGDFSPPLDGQPYASDVHDMLTAAALCNNSRLNEPTAERPIWTCLGDQTEAALRVVAIKGGIDLEQANRHYPRVHELPFDARRKRMTTIHELNDTQDRRQSPQVAWIKGAPREVLGLCTHIQLNGRPEPLTNDFRTQILAANDDFSRRALRVLALAYRELPPRTRGYTVENVEHDLVFLGLAAMHDPPRPEVAQAVQQCHRAGIRLVMITGDYGLTAESLARRVGMLRTQFPDILTGNELDEISDQELEQIIQRETIFARMAPEHKLRLVAAFQKSGEVVAVTGDGVNDAPALRKADVGVAMGITGSDVAKEAADVILVNDDFSKIAQAVAAGRTVYRNLRKFVTYIFASNVPQVLPFLFTGLFHIPLAIGLKQILSVDMGTDLVPSIGLSQEVAEPDVMNDPPRKITTPLVDRKLLNRAFLWLGSIEALLSYLSFILVFALAGVDWPGGLLSRLPFWEQLGILGEQIGFGGLSAEIATMMGMAAYHAGMIMAQVGNAFACRSERNRSSSLGWGANKTLLVGVGIQVFAILVFIYFPLAARLFGYAPLPGMFWYWLGLLPLIQYGLEWIRKFISRRVDAFARLRRLEEVSLHSPSALGS